MERRARDRTRPRLRFIFSPADVSASSRRPDHRGATPHCRRMVVTCDWAPPVCAFRGPHHRLRVSSTPSTRLSPPSHAGGGLRDRVRPRQQRRIDRRLAGRCPPRVGPPSPAQTAPDRVAAAAAGAAPPGSGGVHSLPGPSENELPGSACAAGRSPTTSRPRHPPPTPGFSGRLTDPGCRRARRRRVRGSGSRTAGRRSAIRASGRRAHARRQSAR